MEIERARELQSIAAEALATAAEILERHNKIAADLREKIASAKIEIDEAEIQAIAARVDGGGSPPKKWELLREDVRLNERASEEVARRIENAKRARDAAQSTVEAAERGVRYVAAGDLALQLAEEAASIIERINAVDDRIANSLHNLLAKNFGDEFGRMSSSNAQAALKARGRELKNVFDPDAPALAEEMPSPPQAPRGMTFTRPGQDEFPKIIPLDLARAG